jgi:hypothetical protein
MSRQALTAQSLPGPGEFLAPTFSSLSGVTGVEFQNSGNEWLEVINGSTASTATVNFGFEVDGQEVEPFSVALPVSNTTPQRIGPFSSKYTQADGNVYIDLTSITGVTVAVVQCPGVV